MGNVIGVMSDKSQYETWAATTGLALEQEVKGWIEKCQRIEGERDELRAEVADLLPRMDADALTISNLAAEVKQAWAMCEMWKATAEQSSAEVERLQAQVATFKQFGDLDTNNQNDLADEVEWLRGAIEQTWRPEVAALRKRSDSFEAERDETWKIANRHLIEKADALAEVERLRTERDRFKDDAESYANAFDDEKREVERVYSERNDAVDEVVLLRDERAAALAEVERLRAALAGLLDVGNLSGEAFDRHVAAARDALYRPKPRRIYQT